MNKTWVQAAGLRSLKTIAETAVGTIGASALLSEIDWLVVASASAVAGILSLLVSVKGLPEISAEK